MLSFGFTPTKDDYLKAFRTFYLSSWPIWALLIFVSLPQAVCIFIAVLRGEFGDGYLLILPAIILLTGVIVLISLLFIGPLRVANKVEKDERLHSPVQYECSDEQIHFKDQFSELKTDWASYQQYIESKELFLLIYTANKNMFQIIPKRAFKSPDDEAAFRDLLLSKKIKRKSSPFKLQMNPWLIIGSIALIGLCFLVCAASFIFSLIRNSS